MKAGLVQALALALAFALAGSAVVKRASAREQEPVRSNAFMDSDGEQQQPEELYRARLGARKPGHLLTIAEELLFLAGGTSWYWVDRDHNVGDWDYPSWEERMTLRAWRFDNNTFPMNFLAHPLNGAAFYGFPRANDHELLVSSAYAFATSFAWEFLLEFREKVSVNDLIVTQVGGMPIGEFSAKLWHYLNGLPERPTSAQKAISASVGFPVWLKRRAYGESRPATAARDDLGYSSAIRRRLGAGYAARSHAWTGSGVTVHGAWLGGRLSSIPGEGRPGSFSLFFHDADVVSLQAFGGLGDRARELDVQSDMHLLGLYTQAFDARGRGSSATFGVAMGYRYRYRDFTSYDDRLGLAHLPGPGVDLVLRNLPIELGLSWRLGADFAGIHSAAYGDWADARVTPGERPKSILRKHGYHYAWGGSSRLAAQLMLPLVDLSAGVLLGAYDSQEGLDRTQEELTLDPDATERVLELETSAGVIIPTTPVRIGAGFAISERQSQVDGFVVERALHTFSLSLGLSI